MRGLRTEQGKRCRPLGGKIILTGVKLGQLFSHCRTDKIEHLMAGGVTNAPEALKAGGYSRPP